MATARMKPSVPDRTEHLVVVDVDGVVDEVLVATADDAEQLAAAVVDAAAALATIVLPVGGFSSGGFVVVGHIVHDLAKAKRTSVRVESRSLQFASMGIKK
ncbi:MAG: hypothetical protein KDB40_00290 [Acidimicrobiales bacterium]|nr:hypothetical protein [Acidimicrobiales bacterium]MCB9392834.1 hypothetical protein [Acidimicrobiaceae bacterium]